MRLILIALSLIACLMPWRMGFAEDSLWAQPPLMSDTGEIGRQDRRR